MWILITKTEGVKRKLCTWYTFDNWSPWQTENPLESKGNLGIGTDRWFETKTDCDLAMQRIDEVGLPSVRATATGDSSAQRDGPSNDAHQQVIWIDSRSIRCRTLFFQSKWPPPRPYPLFFLPVCHPLRFSLSLSLSLSLSFFLSLSVPFVATLILAAYRHCLCKPVSLFLCWSSTFYAMIRLFIRSEKWVVRREQWTRHAAAPSGLRLISCVLNSHRPLYCELTWTFVFFPLPFFHIPRALLLSPSPWSSTVSVAFFSLWNEEPSFGTQRRVLPLALMNL